MSFPATTGTALSTALTPARRRRIGQWLLTCAGMCWGAVTIGGLTRLTESGLSITEWNVLKGIAPPLNDAQWQHQFDLYKATPEYRQ